ncbi:MAG: AbrB/MazE/SpoVT family DNA-binding domain-containing protein [Acidobacteriota bacterium]|nr:AbrB/MazE/SpoVT family DNA-binding domain-containing protein [Acidobacteriota bacterium]
MTSTISSKGQITVPVAIREALGLKPGTTVIFELVGSKVVLEKKPPLDHPVDKIFGILAVDRPVDDLIDEMRGQRPSRGS